MTKLSKFIYFFTVFYNITTTGSTLQFPKFEYHFDRSGLRSVPKVEDGHIRYQTGTYKASLCAGR